MVARDAKLGGRAARRWRRGSRGAAMVEAVAVVPTFVILMAASIFIWRLYVAKIQVMGDTRFKLWTYAISENCGDPGDPGVGGNDAPTVALTGSVSSGEADNGLGGTGFDGQTSQGYGDVQGGDSTNTLHKTLGQVSYGEKGGQVQAASVFGGFSASTSAQRTMLCNEPPHNGNLFGLAKAAVHTLTSW